MKTYAIVTALGIVVIMAETPIEAWMKYVTQETPLGDFCLDREDLIKRGYTHIEATREGNVFELLKNE